MIQCRIQGGQGWALRTGEMLHYEYELVARLENKGNIFFFCLPSQYDARRTFLFLFSSPGLSYSYAHIFWKESRFYLLIGVGLGSCYMPTFGPYRPLPPLCAPPMFIFVFSLPSFTRHAVLLFIIFVFGQPPQTVSGQVNKILHTQRNEVKAAWPRGSKGDRQSHAPSQRNVSLRWPKEYKKEKSTIKSITK